MENFKVIEFHKVRDFSNKVSTTFEFVRQNFKRLGKSMLYIAGPPVLMASLLIGSFMSELMNFSRIATNAAMGMSPFESSFLEPTFWLQMVLLVVFGVVAAVMSFSTLYNYLYLYNEKKSNDIEVSEVWDRVRATFWMYFGTIFLFYILLIGVGLILIIPLVVLAKISSVLMFFGAIAVFCALFYLMVSGALVFPIRAFEDKSFFDAVGRSFVLVKGKVWSTFGIMFVLSIIGSIISYVFIIPWYVLNAVNMLHTVDSSLVDAPSTAWETVTIISYAIYYMVQILLYALPNIGIVLQYFNLVERKEAKGLLGSIDSLGQDQPTPAQDEQF
ncbi:hypothetical protein [Chryseolinea lacunae]|uniref:DUF975 family protein n=1 Tax=Chryseolinea lacunae TaxID=2801331 RepID=A0ABS1KQA8_9BACT|nr:hypothetical protein [Chryseolinea lacunae]MBL0741488.1 hypothetical protein [Chryseolinea lacunae]